jgi:ADP-dependent NAD(P)H-hydrate dehydratase / NAD(P)H-hydrate epimerase
MSLEVVELELELLRSWYRSRRSDAYKNQAGHVAIVAGSLGFTGAAALTAEAALSGGAGLVSLYVDSSIHTILAIRCPPEIMVHPLPPKITAATLSDVKADVFAFGPGIGSSPDEAFLDWLQSESRPIVVDADGLKLMARHLDKRLSIAQAGPRVATPHPGEFARLFPEETKLPTRRERAEAVAQTFPLTLLYKGEKTLIAQQGGPMHRNTTGNPGMATGGMGDVLTGIIVALLAQGYASEHAACLGAWLAGRAADHAIDSGLATHETLRPTTVIQQLTFAFQRIRS